MKGKEIIINALDANMPDIKQVRNNCINQAIPRSIRYARLITVTIVIAMILCLGTVGYAISRVLLNRADTGGDSVLVIVEDESEVGLFAKYNEETDTYDLVERPMSESEMEEEAEKWADPNSNLLAGGLLMFDKETADKINGYLAFLLFDSYGNHAFGRLVPVVAGGYTYMGIGDNAYQSAYDSNGNKIINIRWDAENQGIGLLYADNNAFSMNDIYSYNEATALFGQDFAVAEVPGFRFEAFQYNDYYVTGSDSVRLYVNYINDAGQIAGYYVEKLREESVPANEWRVTGTVEEIEVSGITVYKQRDADGIWGRYMWQSNGATYCLFYNNELPLTDGEYEQVIQDIISQ